MRVLLYVALACSAVFLSGCGRYHLVTVPYELCEEKSKEKCSTGFSAYFYNDLTGVLYTWGSNDFGQLGVGDVKDKNNAQKVKLTSSTPFE